MWITLNQIECLSVVASTGSLHQASLSLRRSKSSISYALHGLEEQIGFKLLDRSGYRIKLTPQGEAFLIKGKDLLEQAEQLKDRALSIGQGVEARFRISCTEMYPLEKVTSVLRQVASTYPDTELIFHREILSGEKMLREEMVDMAIFEHLYQVSEFEHKVISETRLKLCLARSHPFSAPGRIKSIEDLFDLPQIIQRSTLPDEISFGVYGQSRRWTVSDTLTKKQLILEGLGWGRLPDFLVEQELASNKLIHLKSIESQHPVKVYLCRHKKKKHGKINQMIWDLF
jgi:DNA-binding transcriptional LysR family regulator